MARRVNNKGQSSLPEYVVTFFIVIAAVVAMTTYVQRSLQARTKDARDHMFALASPHCDADCREAASIAGNGIPREYEPYYGNMDTLTNRSSSSAAALQGGVELINGQRRLFGMRKDVNEITESASDSRQLPPMQANEDFYGKGD